MNELIDACACPRDKASEIPACKVVQLIRSPESAHGVLFVSNPKITFCQSAMRYGDSLICLCKNRLKLYLEHGR
jgi:hypothetical protein